MKDTELLSLMYQAKTAFMRRAEEEVSYPADSEDRAHAERATEEAFGFFARAANAAGLVASWDGATHNVNVMRTSLAVIAYKSPGEVGELALRALK